MGKKSRRRVVSIREHIDRAFSECQEKEKQKFYRDWIADAELEKQSTRRMRSNAASIRCIVCSECNNFIDSLMTNGRPMAMYKEENGNLRVATYGMGLIGYPEIHAIWPIEREEALFRVVSDIIVSAMQSTFKVEKGRHILEARFDLVYKMETYEMDLESGPYERFLAAEKQFLCEGNSHAVEMKLVTDISG